MAKREITVGSTDQTIDVFIQDSSSTTGAGLAGLVYNSASLACYYRKGATGSATQLSLATQTVGGAHSDGGFVEIQATNMKGVYRLDLSDTMVAAAGMLTIMLYGATNMAPVVAEVEVVATNKYDAVRGGMTALPNANADAAGGLPISDAGGLDLDAKIGALTFTVANKVDANATHISGDSVAADNAESFFDGTGYAGTNNVIPTVTTVTTATNVTTVNGLAAGVITASSIAADAITAAKIADGAIDAATFAAGAITASAIAADAIGASELAADAVTEIAAGISIPSAATIASQVRTELTTELARIDVATSTRLATAGYTAPLDAAGTRTAVGLASANLDTQLSTIDDFLDTEIAAIKAKTDNLPSDPADASDVAAAITAAWTTALTESYATDGSTATPAQLLYMLWSAVAEISISGTTMTCKKLDGSTTAMTFTLDSATDPTSRTRAT